MPSDAQTQISLFQAALAKRESDKEELRRRGIYHLEMPRGAGTLEVRVTNYSRHGETNGTGSSPS